MMLEVSNKLIIFYNVIRIDQIIKSLETIFLQFALKECLIYVFDRSAVFFMTYLVKYSVIIQKMPFREAAKKVHPLLVRPLMP